MPAGDKTRPTADRVREALFSALTAWAGTSGSAAEQSFAGLSFCDLYAGSGAVGLEAASRGARPVLLVEADKRTSLTTDRNARELELAVVLRTGRVEQLVSQPDEHGYDIVFADPPYDLSAQKLEAVLGLLVENRWVAPDGLVVLERARRTAELNWPSGFDDTWTRRYGETVLLFGQRFAVLPPPPLPTPSGI